MSGKGRGVWLKFVSSKSKTFVAFCFCFLLGVVVASLRDQRELHLFFILVFFVCLGLSCVCAKQKTCQCVCIALFCFTGGMLRYAFVFPHDSTHIFSLNGEHAELTGMVADEPDVRIDGVRYIIDAQSRDADFSGRVYLTLGLYPRYSYGDTVAVLCDLETPEPSDTFRYDMYMARIGVFSVCEKPVVKKIGDNQGARWFTKILNIKMRLAERIYSLWHEPYASLVAGLLYGYRGGLGTLNTAFNRTGVTPLIAISGYNISVIATIIRTTLIRVWIPRKKAFYLVVGGIILFVIFTGASASVVRAGIMGILVLVAQQAGRLSQTLNVILLTVVLMVFHNPLILFWDAGFQLSCGSTLGIVYLSPIVHNKCAWIPELLGLRESFTSTMSAILFTFPLIVFQFGRFSAVAPVVNVLILWTIPWIMLASALTLLLSFISRFLFWLPHAVASFGMMYVVSVVKFFSGFPFASIDFRMPLFSMIAIYALLITYIFIYYHRRKYEKTT